MTEAAIQFIDLKAQQDRIGDKISKAIEKVLAHGAYIMGPEVAELENKLSEFCGAKHVITCSSGTDALLMALLAFEVKPGDAIFMPSFTFVATAEVVALLGATPFFIDVRQEDYLIDPAQLERGIKQATDLGLKPRGIIPVDLFGLPADYAAIKALAAQAGLFVIGDAAQSFGASYRGKKTGTLADVSATSFFPAKPLGCYGDGGAVFTDDDALADRLRSTRVHGKGKDKYDNVNIGINGRLDTIQAAILLEKLAVFADEIAQRHIISERYSQALAELVDVPLIPDNHLSAWAQYTIKCEQRDALAAKLKQSNIPSAVYYPKPLHQQSAYRQYPTTGSMGNSERLSATVLSLPMHPYLSEETQDFIIEACQAALGAARRSSI